MSRYFGYTGKVKIKEEYREDFLLLYLEKYDKIKSKIILDHIENNYGKQLHLQLWNDHPHNCEFGGILQNSYDEATGIYSYGVTYNRNRTENDIAITEFVLGILREISEVIIKVRFWDEYDQLTLDDIENRC